MAEKVKKISWPTIDFTGKSVSSVNLPGEIFGQEINEFAVQRAVRLDLANRRLGTAHTLTRDIVHGTNKKPYRQKGTGRARAGTANSPIWRHGGVVHGPTGHENYSLKMNKKESEIAFCSVMSDKVKNKNLIVIEDKGYKSNKTKDFVKTLKVIGGSSDKRNLIVLSTLDENLIFASRNLQNVIVTTVENLSVYDVLNSSKLIMFKDTFAEEKEAK